jgi:hypothetical protein
MSVQRETSSSNRVSLGFIGDPELIGFGINRSAEASAESVREKSPAAQHPDGINLIAHNTPSSSAVILVTALQKRNRIHSTWPRACIE